MASVGKAAKAVQKKKLMKSGKVDLDALARLKKRVDTSKAKRAKAAGTAKKVAKKRALKGKKLSGRSAMMAFQAKHGRGNKAGSYAKKK
jgi:hypothetical protein